MKAVTVERQTKYITEMYRVPEGVIETLEKHHLFGKYSDHAIQFYF